MPKTTVISTRVPCEEAARLDRAVAITGTDRATVVRAGVRARVERIVGEEKVDRRGGDS